MDGMHIGMQAIFHILSIREGQRTVGVTWIASSEQYVHFVLCTLRLYMRT